MSGDEYYVAGIGKDYIALAVGRSNAVKVSKNGIDSHINVDAEKICIECEKWNMYDDKQNAFYCPRCESQ